MNQQIHIAFCTGRKTLPLVAGMLAGQLERGDHFSTCDLNLTIAYDPGFQGLSPLDFALPSQVERCFAAVNYLGPAAWEQLAWMRDSFGLDPAGFEVLFKPRGYCSQKNIALAHALLSGAERLLFLDDDEYFAAPFKGAHGGLVWEEQDVLGAHGAGLRRAAITHGIVVGYPMPVPSDLDQYLGEELRRRLGKALALGTEFIGEESFLCPAEPVRYGDRDFLRGLPCPVEMERGVRPMSGGNIAFDLNAVRAGHIPPYFNPPGARGEDSILGAQLSGVAFHRIPACIFHDPFQQYPGIAQGRYPQRLEPVATGPATLERFCRAFIGWVRYAPLLLRLTVGDAAEREERIGRMRAALQSIGPELERGLGWRGFSQGARTLEVYQARVQKDFDDLERAKEAWSRLMQGV